jgi:hypothetical protein
MKPAALLTAFLCLAAGPLVAGGNPKSPFQVLGAKGALRLYRFETVPWPLEPGSRLPEGSRVELDAGALLGLRYLNYVDFDLAGPARCAVYGVPSPEGGEGGRRVVLKLDQGFLLVDGRFQFGRPADVVLSLPDRVLDLPAGQRFFVHAGQGRSEFYVPMSGTAEAVAPADLSGGAMSALAPLRAAPAGAVPRDLFDELSRPVPLFVLARDFNQDLGLWPRPAILGPLLAERMAAIPGIVVVEGSGDTAFSYKANGALKKGDDSFLKGLALAQGARWVLVGNCVSDTPPQESAPNLRRVRGQAEVRLLEADGEDGGLELVSEEAVTRVARAGRPIEQASWEASEAASDEVARYMQGHVEDLLAGRSHAAVLIQFEADNVDQAAMEALRARLESLDSVQHLFRRSFSRRTAIFDLILRKDLADFDAQWAAVPEPDGAWRWKSLSTTEPGLRRIRAQALGRD